MAQVSKKPKRTELTASNVRCLKKRRKITKILPRKKLIDNTEQLCKKYHLLP